MKSLKMKEKEMKRSKSLLTAAIIGIGCLVCLMAIGAASPERAIDAEIAAVLEVPHMTCAEIVAIFTWLEWVLRAGGPHWLAVFCTLVLPSAICMCMLCCS